MSLNGNELMMTNFLLKLIQSFKDFLNAIHLRVIFIFSKHPKRGNIIWQKV